MFGFGQTGANKLKRRWWFVKTTPNTFSNREERVDYTVETALPVCVSYLDYKELIAGVVKALLTGTSTGLASAGDGP